jgi:hypothetical protein
MNTRSDRVVQLVTGLMLMSAVCACGAEAEPEELGALESALVPECVEFRTHACALANETDDTPIVAGSIGQTSLPSVMSGVAYRVILPSTPNPRQGAVAFTPAVSGRYELYLELSAVNFQIAVNQTFHPLACRFIGSEEACPEFRRTDGADFTAGVTYRLLFGANDLNSVRLLIAGP